VIVAGSNTRQMEAVKRASWMAEVCWEEALWALAPVRFPLLSSVLVVGSKICS
jgi:hypothetical protein